MKKIFLLMLAAVTMAPALAKAANDVPQVWDVQRKAIEFARLEPSDITSWKKRVRYAALLPKLQLEYYRKLRDLVNVDINDNVYVGSSGSTVGPDEANYSRDYDMNNDVVVKAVWSLNETVFNPDMLSVSSEARNLARDRQYILQEVNKSYYERKKLIGEIEFLKKQLARDPDPEKIRHDIFLARTGIGEATGALDALTGGWFSQNSTQPDDKPEDDRRNKWKRK